MSQCIKFFECRKHNPRVHSTAMRSRMRNGMSLTQDCLYLVQITLTKLQQCRKHRKKMGRIEFTALGETSPNGQIVAFRVQGQVQTCDPTTSSTLGQYQRLKANVSVRIGRANV